ncbi:hypothetical protein DRB96_14235 [Streptomyces sp. ICC1]|nr:hypothetical protein DRB89_09925 [Streptomyces sp. ICC4]AWZ13284.1 hypothetical protein DRB96_14235 [Streptomyces sp. ICC1]
MITDECGTESQQPVHLLIARGLGAQTQMDPVLDRLGLGHLVEVERRPLRQQHLGLPVPRSGIRIHRTARHTAPEPGQPVGIRTVDRHVLHY